MGTVEDEEEERNRRDQLELANDVNQLKQLTAAIKGSHDRLTEASTEQ